MFSIGGLRIDHPFILAPLAGYSDLAFRLLCREYGAGLCFSEMISCHGLHFRQKNTLDMIRTSAAERPVAMQLFGSEPEVMGEAAAILSEQPIDLIDINMGCPVKKVIKKGAGCALMKDPALAAEIILAVVKTPACRSRLSSAPAGTTKPSVPATSLQWPKKTERRRSRSTPGPGATASAAPQTGESSAG